MIVLGISDNHGAGAALVRKGKLVAAVNQERINREKNTMAFPWEAIDQVLSIGGIAPEDVDLVTVGSEFTPIFFLRLIKGLHRSIKRRSSQFSLLFDLYVVYHVLVRLFRPLRAMEIALSRELFLRRFARRGFLCDIHLVDHHTAHAYAAYLTGPYEPATVITADAMGDGISVTVGIGRGGRVTRLFAQDGRCAFNPYYSRITEFLGFVPNRHEGKVTGLAAYGDVNKLLPLFRKHARFLGPGFNTYRFRPLRWPHDGFYGKLRHYDREDIAAACQNNLETQMSAFVQYWCRRTGIDRVVLAGGIFENVKLNQRVHELPEVRGIYIFPNMSDSGLAAGCALKLGRRAPQPYKTPFLGMDYSRRRMESAAAGSGLVITRPPDMAGCVAALLAEGKVVARFDGRMEYGPRALGHRSILYRPDDPAVNDWLNEKLKRTEFMPFAPVVRAQRAAECFHGLEGALFTARFMNICFDCTDLMKKSCPGVVHVDGTARPQIIRREEDPVYYDILRNFEGLTGLPAMLNTSFNMHEEPIVATPEDAVRAFLAAKLPVLSLGSLLLTLPGEAGEKGKP